MSTNFKDVGGAFEAALDGRSVVVLRAKGTTGPNFHLTRDLLTHLMAMLRDEETRDDDSGQTVVRFRVLKDGENMGTVDLKLGWSVKEVFAELKTRGYSLEGFAVFIEGWPSIEKFMIAVVPSIFATTSLFTFEADAWRQVVP